MSSPIATKRGLAARFQRAIIFGWRRRTALMTALPMLGLVSYRLRRFGYARTVSWLDQRTPPDRTRPNKTSQDKTSLDASNLDGTANGSARAIADELAYVVRAAAKVIPDATCLRRALVLRHLLRREGIGSTVRLGVRPTDDSGLDFHAWLVVGDEVVSERERLVADYVILDDGQAPPAMRS